MSNEKKLTLQCIMFMMEEVLDDMRATVSPDSVQKLADVALKLAQAFAEVKRS